MLVHDVMTDILEDEILGSCKHEEMLARWMNQAYKNNEIQLLNIDRQYAILKFIGTSLINKNFELKLSLLEQKAIELDRLNRLEVYKWIPQCLNRANRISECIFRIATMDCRELERSLIDTGIKKLWLIREDIDKEEYKYRGKEEIKVLYVAELLDSVLDRQYINSETKFMSGGLYAWKKHKRSNKMLSLKEIIDCCKGSKYSSNETFEVLISHIG